MDSDETKFLPNHRSSGDDSTARPESTDNEPFAFGDSTIFQLRNQDFQPLAPENDVRNELPFSAPDEFGTMVQRPLSLDTLAAQIETPVPEAAAAPAAAALQASDDPLVRLEQKLDLALRQLQLMQQRLESLDATIARSLLR
jgi:hypothetical protein